MVIEVPELALVVVVGPQGSGRAALARRLFGPTEVVSEAMCRAMVADDPHEPSAVADADEVLRLVVGKRLARGRLTAVDAPNVQGAARARLLEVAKAHHVPAVAVVLDLPLDACLARGAEEGGHRVDEDEVRRQHELVHRAVDDLRAEGFRRVHVLTSDDDVAGAELRRTRLPTDRRHEQGPFDLIGDVHGCVDELCLLLERLGYDIAPDRSTAHHVGRRRAVFLGDLADRGPDTPAVFKLVMGMVADGSALCVPGNHDQKLARALRGGDVVLSPGRVRALTQLDAHPESFRLDVARFIEGLVSHLVLDDGRLVAAHAGLPAHMHNRVSAEVRRFALHGDLTGEVDDDGRPVRLPWEREYDGDALVVHGHTPMERPTWVGNVCCIDTGCVFGGHLTALRYPELDIVDVKAERVWYERPPRPEVAVVAAG
jgi:protein phosphatase